jgi:hypothetical protein
MEHDDHVTMLAGHGRSDNPDKAGQDELAVALLAAGLDVRPIPRMETPTAEELRLAVASGRVPYYFPALRIVGLPGRLGPHPTSRRSTARRL